MAPDLSTYCTIMSGMTDPLTALHNDDEDIFKSTFNGAKGTYKITSALSPTLTDDQTGAGLRCFGLA